VPSTGVLPTDQAELTLRTISASCGSSSCPTIYESDRGTLVVQGYTVAAERTGLAMPEGEQLVEIPVDLLINAARHVSLITSP
jgi:hypothetical protein